MKFTEDSPEYKLLLEWWMWLANHYQPEDTDEWWADAIQSISAIASKYKGTHLEEMATELTLVALNQIERNFRSSCRK